jgi:hypothetical protein
MRSNSLLYRARHSKTSANSGFCAAKCFWHAVNCDQTHVSLKGESQVFPDALAICIGDFAAALYICRFEDCATSHAT